MKLKDQARSISAKLSKLSKELDTSYLNILTEFLLERLTDRLVSVPELSKKLVFKGGFVSLRIYDSPRYTIDLDALLSKGKLEDVVPLAKEAAEQDAGDGVWFRFEKTVDLETQGEYGGLRIVFRAGLGDLLKDLKRAQVVHLDMCIGDPVTPNPINAKTPFLLGSGTLSWAVYPAETTVSEKLHGLIVRGSQSSRSKDIFDITLLIKKCKKTVLKKALSNTFRARGDRLPNDLVGHLSEIDRTLLRKGWASAVEGIAAVADFDEVFDELLEALSKVWPTELTP